MLPNICCPGGDWPKSPPGGVPLRVPVVPNNPPVAGGSAPPAPPNGLGAGAGPKNGAGAVPKRLVATGAVAAAGAAAAPKSGAGVGAGAVGAAPNMLVGVAPELGDAPNKLDDADPAAADGNNPLLPLPNKGAGGVIGAAAGVAVDGTGKVAPEKNPPTAVGGAVVVGMAVPAAENSELGAADDGNNADGILPVGAASVAGAVVTG